MRKRQKKTVQEEEEHIGRSKQKSREAGGVGREAEYGITVLNGRECLWKKNEKLQL